ncbi:MAG: hypothetical protein WKG06_06195 [Segetibacter sp.]
MENLSFIHHYTVMRNTFLFLMLLCMQMRLHAQQNNCIFKEPALKIDFGTGNDIPAINIFPLPNYRLVKNACPDDGYYSFVSSTGDCFNGDWLSFNEDHTPGDQDGRMMLVNASYEGGIFFNTIISGLQGNTIYELAASMVNVCRISGGCSPLPPDITIKLLTTAGQTIATFQTGRLSQNASPRWKVYSGLFRTPADITTLILTMEDIIPGGCGNDFAVDDITFRECVKPEPVIKPEVKPQEKVTENPPIVTAKLPVKKLPGLAKPAVKKTPVILSPVKDTLVATIKKQVVTPEVTKPVIKEKPVAVPAPKPLLTRANPLIKQIETEEAEIEINLYDNGEIDNDTVSVYHNNELIVSRARLSAKPVTFSIKVDTAHPYHELIMVANNLGSIPPNTSMMIITTKDKRYEVFISSSEQKNAKIVIGLKE